MSKNLSQSKTFWLNILSLAVTGLMLVNHDLLTNFGVPAEAQPVILSAAGTVVAVLNILLRKYFTATAIK